MLVQSKLLPFLLNYLVQIIFMRFNFVICSQIFFNFEVFGNDVVEAYNLLESATNLDYFRALYLTEYQLGVIVR